MRPAAEMFKHTQATRIAEAAAQLPASPGVGTRVAGPRGHSPTKRAHASTRPHSRCIYASTRHRFTHGHVHPPTHHAR